MLLKDNISMLLTVSWGLPLLYWLWKGSSRGPWAAVLAVALTFSVGPQLNLGDFELVKNQKFIKIGYGHNSLSIGPRYTPN